MTKSPGNRGFSLNRADGRGWDRTSDPSRVNRSRRLPQVAVSSRNGESQPNLAYGRCAR
jgi:hypothetical protein